MHNIEIDQQTDAYPAQPHVRQKLSLVNWMNCVDALHFDDDKVLDHQIDPVSELNLLSVENHREADLARHIKATLSEFVDKTALISALQQPGHKNGVHVHSGRYDCTRDLINAK